MGFLNALKGANNNWGVCTSQDFTGPCYLGPKNLVNNRAQELMISGTALKEDYVFTKDDVADCTVKASGGTWIWFHIAFKDGKHVEFILAGIVDQAGKPTTNFLNFICFMGI